MEFKGLQDTLQNLTNAKISQNDIGNALGINASTVNTRMKRGSRLKLDEIRKIEKAFGVVLVGGTVMNEKAMRYNDFIEKLQRLTGRNITVDEIAPFSDIGRIALEKVAKNNGFLSDTDIENIERAFEVRIKDWGYKEGSSAIRLKYYPDVYLSAGFGVEVQDEHFEMTVIDERFLTSERGMRVRPEYCEIVRVSGQSMYPEYQHGDRVIIDKNDKNLTDGQIYAIRYEGQCYIKEINRAGRKIKCISINKEYEPFFIEPDVDFEVFGRILPRIRL